MALLSENKQTKIMYKSAKELQEKGNIKKSGEYLLALTCPSTNISKIVPIYCANMNTSEPKEYITLQRSWRVNKHILVTAIQDSSLSKETSFSDCIDLIDIIMYFITDPLEQPHNFSTLRSGGTAKGTSIRTVFDRVRFDINKFEIICYDLTYSTTNKDGNIVLVGSNGTCRTVYDSFYFGCGYGSSSGESNWASFDVNLCGTKFEINSKLCTFKPFGWRPSGKLDKNENPTQHISGKGIGYQGGIGACPSFARFRNILGSGNAIEFARKAHVTIPLQFKK
eukprot:253723_1